MANPDFKKAPHAGLFFWPASLACTSFWRPGVKPVRASRRAWSRCMCMSAGGFRRGIAQDVTGPAECSTSLAGWQAFPARPNVKSKKPRTAGLFDGTGFAGLAAYFLALSRDSCMAFIGSSSAVAGGASAAPVPGVAPGVGSSCAGSGGMFFSISIRTLSRS